MKLNDLELVTELKAKLKRAEENIQALKYMDKRPYYPFVHIESSSHGFRMQVELDPEMMNYLKKQSVRQLNEVVSKLTELGVNV